MNMTQCGSPLLSLFILLLVAAIASAGHLRESGLEVGAEAGAEAGVSSEDASASVKGGSSSESKDLLAKTLLSIADRLEGKPGTAGGGARDGVGSGAETGAADREHAEFEKAVLQAVKVLGKHHQTKVTMEQIAAAMKKNSGAGKVGKVTVGQILAALRLDPLKPKDPPVDKKKLLATAVGAVEAKLDQLASMIANAKADPVDKTPEELASHDMQHGLESAPVPVLPPPVNFRLNMEHPALPQDQ